MTVPLVSVVMPVRDGGELVPSAARSILEQTFSDLELVIVDDASPEPTRSILRQLQAEDERVVLLDRKHGDAAGIADTLNAGFVAARGRYFARMDADDISLPRRLEQQVRLLDRESEVGLVGGQMIAIDPGGSHLWRFAYPTDDSDIRALLRAANPFGHPTVLMRREVFEACGGYRDACLHTEDYELWVRMLDRCHGANLPDSVLLYRVHPDQTAFRDWRQQCLSGLAVQAAVRVRRAEGRDPLEGIELVTDATLRELGVSELAIHTRLVESLLGLSNMAGRAGIRADRERLLAQAKAEAGRGPLEPGILARLALVEAVAAFEQRAYGPGVACVAKSLSVDSGAAIALTARWVFRRHRGISGVVARARTADRQSQPA